MADGECVKVIVRCRPMNTREKDLKCKSCLTMEGKRGQCAIRNPSDAKAPPKLFTFDGAYYTDSTTENIYNEIAYPLVEGVTEGYNGTIFAYGQTGCGKSFTMQGITDPATQRGIIPRSFDHIFETVSVSEDMKFLLHASYCEIYNEEIRDLLGKDIKTKLDLKEHPEKGVYVNGLSMHPVHNVHDCEKIMARGWSNRATGATLMNADSSRSHSIFTINIEMCSTDEEGEDHIRAGKLNLVDLAGSERQAKTGATGDRLKEATKINLSLSALGNVISALVDGKSKHIPYRDSKLTRLLQDSLGGNTKTLMVACLSPADNNYEETLSTLRYANRAKNIQNKPKINEDPKDALLREYQEEIQKLKAMLLGQIPVSGIESSGSEPAKGSQREDLSREDLEDEKERIREVNNLVEEYDSKLVEMKAEYEREKADKGKIQQDMLKLRAFYDTKLSSVDGQIAGLPPTAAGKTNKKSLNVINMAKSVKVLGEVEWRDENGQMLKIEEDYVPEGFGTGQQAKGGQEVVTQDGQQVNDQQVNGQQQQNGDVAAAAVAGEVIGPDGTKIIYKTINNTEYITNTEYVEVEKLGPNGEVPESVIGNQLPTGPEVKTLSTQNAAEDGHQEEVTAVMVGGAPVLEQEGMVAPSSSPTQSNMQEQLKLHQEEAMRRLQELEKQMVGGENKDNKDVKDRRRKRIKFADERKARLAEAIANMDDDFILLQIYDETQQEVKDKDSEVKKEQLKVTSLEREIIDLQSEFQFDRIDYLDTIRKQEKQLKLLESLLEKVHPCLRRDCNYANLDKIKLDCKYDEEEGKWILPRMMIQTTSLPVAEGIMPGARTMDTRARRSINGDLQASFHDNEEDRFREKIMKKSDNSNSYFQGKRASQLLQSSEPITKFNINEVKETYKAKASPRMINGHSHHDVEPMSSGLRAAAVHGQLLQEDTVVRRPMRLEALPSVGSKKGRKKKNNTLEPL